ncbi:MAG TPA: hypothetical protein VME20_10380 [Acidimicrobiales bacterium]|nr:hypothetical protein [Acidimicrobiales bacterium]
MKPVGVSGALRAVWTGTLAGAVGTAAMDFILFGRYRRSGGKQGLIAWETAEDVESWDHASGPGRVGQLLLKQVTGREPPSRWARPTTNLVHWMTGLAWGAQFGLVSAATRRPRWQLAALFGPTVWLTGYVVLPLAKVYKPIWEYDGKTLAKDLSAHMAYGVVTAATFSALARSPGGP